MSEEIKKWNPEDAINSIKDRIRAEFVQMIPAEQFTEMVRSVVNSYTTKSEHYNSRQSFSDFDSTVKRELEDATKKEVVKLLDSPEWTGKWNGQNQEASDAVKSALAEHGAKILNTWLGNAFQQMIQNARMQ